MFFSISIESREKVASGAVAGGAGSGRLSELALCAFDSGHVAAHRAKERGISIRWCRVVVDLRFGFFWRSPADGELEQSVEWWRGYRSGVDPGGMGVRYG